MLCVGKLVANPSHDIEFPVNVISRNLKRLSDIDFRSERPNNRSLICLLSERNSHLMERSKSYSSIDVILITIAACPRLSWRIIELASFVNASCKSGMRVSPLGRRLFCRCYDELRTFLNGSSDK
jgi:hypothetical protein